MFRFNLFSQEIVILERYQYTLEQIDSIRSSLAMTNTNLPEKFLRIGMGYAYHQDYVRASKFLLKSIKFSTPSQVNERMEAYQLLSYIYTVLEKKDLRDTYLRKIKNAHQSVTNDSLFYESLSYISVHYFLQNRLDSAIFYQKQIFKKDQSAISPLQLKTACFNTAAYYNHISEFDSALLYIEKGFDVDVSNEMDSFHLNQHEMQGLQTLFDIYYAKGMYQESMPILDNFLKRAESFKDTVYLYHALNSTAKTYRSLNKLDSAYFYLKKAFNVYHTMVTTDKQSALTEAKITADYEYVMTIDSIRDEQLLYIKNIEIESQSRQKRIILASLFIGIFLLVIVSALFIKNRRSNHIILMQKNQAELSLKEKNVLFNELQHRVKNNLQIISSLLEAQAEISNDPEIKKQMSEGQGRIQAMSIVHETLYQSLEIHDISFEQYLRHLIDYITKSHSPNERKVDIKINTDFSTSSMDTLIPLGLIINEIITNSFKYAFVSNENNTLTIFISNQSKSESELVIRDNGVGLPADFELRTHTSLGIRLVEGLAWQLRGSVQFLRLDQGTEVRVFFKH